MNQIICSGRLGHDPSIKTTPSGKKVAEFSLAIDSESHDREAPTTWVRVIAWERQADFCERFLNKGRKVLVQGRLNVREFERTDGTKGQSVEIDGARCEFMDSKPADSGAPAPAREDRSARPAFDATTTRGGQLRASTEAAKGAASSHDDPGFLDSEVPF